MLGISGRVWVWGVSVCEVALLVIAQSLTAITVVDVSCISVLHARASGFFPVYNDS